MAEALFNDPNAPASFALGFRKTAHSTIRILNLSRNDGLKNRESFLHLLPAIKSMGYLECLEMSGNDDLIVILAKQKLKDFPVVVCVSDSEN
jgi:hypothetical protein